MKAKVSAFLTALVTREFTKVVGMPFKYCDRITHAELKAAEAWAASNPEIARALMDKSSPHHATVMLFKSVADHFKYQHPQDAAGEPTAWPDRGQRGEPTEDNPFADLFPDEAQALHAFVQTNSDYMAAYHDATHGQHASRVALTQKLLELASRAEGAEAPAESATPDAAPAAAQGGKMDAKTLKRLDELRAAPAYLEKNHPNHRAAVDAVTRLYEGKPDGFDTSRSTVIERVTGTPAERIAGLKDNAAYWNKSAPGHAAAVQEAASAFAAAHPEPAKP
jgi:hypothetical protein